MADEHKHEMALVSAIVEILSGMNIRQSKEMDAVCGVLIEGIGLAKTRMNDNDQEEWCRLLLIDLKEGLK